MRGNKFDKSHIHLSESETLSRESRVTATVQEIAISPFVIAHVTPLLPFVKNFLSDLDD